MCREDQCTILLFCYSVILLCMFALLYMYLGEHLHRLVLLCNPFSHEIKSFQFNTPIRKARIEDVRHILNGKVGNTIKILKKVSGSIKKRLNFVKEDGGQ